MKLKQVKKINDPYHLEVKCCYVRSFIEVNLVLGIP